MKNRIFKHQNRFSELCILFNHKKFNLSNDLIKLLVKLIVKSEKPQILYNTRIYNIQRSYDKDYINIFINSSITNLIKSPLIDKKFNRYFDIYIKKLMIINYHILKVLKKEKQYNFNQRINRKGTLHQIVFHRYILAFTKKKKIDIESLIKNDYSLLIKIYEKLEKIFINNCEKPEFIENLCIKQI